MITVDGQRQAVSAVLRLPRSRQLPLHPSPLVMGVINVTPDSFSDGGRWLQPERAVEHGLELLAEGADLLDLGAESTRPGGGVYGDGAEPVTAAEEVDRLLPVVEGLRRETAAPLSVDTRKAEVAQHTLAAGADIVNDVSALEDPATASVAARAGAPLILMHSRGSLATMQRRIHFDDVVAEVSTELAAVVDEARNAGVEEDRILVDPGIGFGKKVEHNVTLLARLDEVAGERTLVVGASRKSFLGDLSGAAVHERLPGSLASVGMAALAAESHAAGVIVRVHDVAETVQFLAVWRALREARRERGGMA